MQPRTGQNLVEYAIIISLIAISVAAALMALAPVLSAMYLRVATSLAN